MKFNARYAKLLQDNDERLAASSKRMDAVSKCDLYRDERLGAGESRRFVAAADPSVDATTLPAAQICERVGSLFDSAKVLFATKRRALVRVGEVICCCNRYGVSIFYLPGAMPGMNYHSMEFVPHFNHRLPETLGAYVDGQDRADRVYNYTPLRRRVSAD